jgi:Ca2+-binding RTX toxin-like protein
MKRGRKTRILAVSALALVTVFLTAPSAEAARPRCFGKRATIVGSARADVLRGTSTADVIVGLAGNDVIKGLGGKDRVCAGTGKDSLVGGGGDDLLAGQEGGDRLAGGGGAFDFLIGGPAGDTLNGGKGFADMASYFGAPGPVAVDLSLGTATGDGSDTLTGVEDIDGSSFDDVMSGNAAPNFLFGERGNDTLSGGDGDDDGLIGGNGDDAMDGGSGSDFVSFLFSSAGVTASLTAGTAIGEGSDTLTNIEDVEGSRHDDVLTGNAGPNTFWAHAGKDVIDGGGGTDAVSYFYSANGVTASLATGTATGEGADTLTMIENLFGSPHNDRLTGDAAANRLYGLAGDDTLVGRVGDDTLTGGNGTDTLDGGVGTDDCAGENVVNCEG